jgi:hypothetical protein
MVPSKKIMDSQKGYPLFYHILGNEWDKQVEDEGC